jgi:CheY-like chemotaxis protein
MSVKVETPAQKQQRLFKEYIRAKKITVVDSQASSRAALARTLVELGATIGQITLHSSFAAAKVTIKETCPDILLTEFDLEGGACGLDLLVSQRKANNQSKKSLFILITGNTSQAAVARAAEEDVDGYLLKPYTLDGLRMSLTKYAVEKAYPGPYTMMIEKGKEKIESKDYEDAIKIFEDAKKLDPKPALACFYQGFIDAERKILSNAEGKYRSGLDYNKIHYKCLVALFELFMGQSRNKEAYEVVRKIARYFPANPDRMAAVLRLAVINEAYEDIESYYQLFRRLDHRNETLVRYVCASLIVCGKYYLQKKAVPRAVELFDKAKTTGARNPRLLREIISSLLQYDLSSEATAFLEAYPPEFQGSPEYAALKYAVTERDLPIGQSIDMGRDLIQKGVHEYLLYFVLIRRSLQAGLSDHADQLIAEIMTAWPDKAEDIKKMVREADEAVAS